MDLLDVMKSCFRRWYIVLPILIAASWIGLHEYRSVKPVYYSSAVVGLAPPSMQVQYAGEGKPIPRNGLLDAGGPSLLMNMTVLALGDESVRKQVIDAGGRGNYVARMFPLTGKGAGSEVQLPLILIEATEESPKAANDTVELVGANVDKVLQSIQVQAGVPEDQMAKAFPLSPPSTLAGVPSRSGTISGIAITGGLTAMLAGVLVDVAIRRRRKKMSESSRQHPIQDAKDQNIHPRSDDRNEGRHATFNAGTS